METDMAKLTNKKKPMGDSNKEDPKVNPKPGQTEDKSMSQKMYPKQK
jgi:hypothetical protein